MSQARSVAVRLSAEVSGYISSMRQAGAETKKALGDASKYASDHSRALDDLGGTAGKVGLAAATGLGLVTKAAMDWESAWAGVEKTVDGNAVQMAALEGELRGLAKTLPATHAEIAGVAEAAGQLGVEREAIAGFTRTMVDLGETTNLTAEEAATSIAQMQNVMGTAPADIDNLGAALVALGNDGASTEAQILGMAQRIAGAGAQIGLAESDILAIANASASMGVEVEAGGTAISQTFTAMAKATKQGGAELEAFAQAAGVSTDAFVRSFEEDPAQAFASFIAGLQNINATGGDVFTTLEGLGLSGVRVSQSLLGLAASGDLLTDSLALGEQAWSENTALALEAAKRYETTAAQAQIAWNQIKDAAIEFGEAALPVVAAVADKVGALAGVLGGLPGPVKSAATGLLGITAVLGGGAWFTAKTVTAVTETRDALKGLTGDSGKAAGALGKVGKAAGIAGIALAGLAVADAFSRIGDETVPGLEDLTRQLIDLADAGTAASLSSEFDSLGESIERLANPNGAQKLQDNLAGVLGFGGGSELREATAEVEGLDAALANLVATGNADIAADALAKLGLSGDQMDDLLSLMPQYSEALAAIENDATLAASSTDAFAGSQRAAADAAREEADALLEAVDAMKEKRDEALRGMNAELDYQAALDDGRKALQENGRTVDISTEKGRANMRALYDQAAAWNAQSDAARNAPGAHRAAIRSFVDLATKMGMSRTEARQLAREILNLPDKKVSITADSGPAMSEIIRLSAMRIPDKSFRVTAVYGTAGATYDTRPGVGGGRYATGGQIPGWSPHKRADNIPVMATAGEYMHQVDAVDYYGLSVMDAINHRRIPKAALAGYAYGGHITTAGTGVQHLATGGNVNRITAKDLRAFNLDGDIGVSEVRAALADFRREVRAAGRTWTKAMDRAAKEAVRTARSYEQAATRLEKLKDSRSSLVQATSGVFDNDPFGNGLAQAMTQLSADANDSASLERLLRRAKRLGLSGAAFQAIAQSGDLGTLGELDTKAEATALNQAFIRRDRAQASAGRYAGDAAFGGLIRQQTRVMSRLDRKLGGFERTIERAFVKGLSGGAGRAGQRRRTRR